MGQFFLLFCGNLLFFYAQARPHTHTHTHAQWHAYAVFFSSFYMECFSSTDGRTHMRARPPRTYREKNPHKKRDKPKPLQEKNTPITGPCKNPQSTIGVHSRMCAYMGACAYKEENPHKRRNKVEGGWFVCGVLFDSVCGVISGRCYFYYR